MREAVFVHGVRTAIGRYGGVLKDVPVVDLLQPVLEEVIRVPGFDPATIDDVIIGQCYQNGEATNVGRYGALRAGYPETVPGFTVDRRCASGLTSIIDGAMAIQTGNADVIVAGGVESMSQAEYYVPGPVRWGLGRGSVSFYDRIARGRQTMSPEERFGLIESNMVWAENMARKHGLSREELDEWALRSHQSACAAIDKGYFAEEIVPVKVPQPRGEPQLVVKDQHPRADTSLEALAKLAAPLKGVCTAGNSSGENDAAAAVLIMSEEMADRLGLEKWAYFRSWGVAGVDPRYVGDAVPPAVEKALCRAGKGLADMDLIEINEAFAAQICSNLKVMGLGRDPRTNVNGSGISLGHPVGCTGARIMVTLLHEMRRRGARWGLETMCIGGGQACAAVIERR